MAPGQSEATYICAIFWPTSFLLEHLNQPTARVAMNRQILKIVF